ncbi:PBCV-specific basic adaptor domain-containing protein [Paramecium bursaria Chlorella virus NE-JV-1]|nr:PBCV-specific basic adaptor domain-containing protein [Paramecium bursaria Chlorella virus NE-JV-1]
MASYLLSPQPGSNTSHLIKTPTALANVPIREALMLARQKTKKVFRFDPRVYGAKVLGKGAYGTVFLMRITDASSKGIQEGLAYGGGRIVGSMPRIGENVVVKISKQNRGGDEEFYRDNIRENLVHKRLAIDPCRPPNGARQKPVCVSKYVPKFYVSFIDGSPRKLESVTVMGLAGDMSLNKFVGSRKIPSDLYVDVERAICAMWLAGYLHGDLHRENIMIDTKTKRVHIIDFGFAMKMPPGFVDVLDRRISGMIARGDPRTLGDVWTDKPIDGKLRLLNYSNRVMKGRGFPWYNPDYKILRSLWNQVPKDARKKIPSERSVLWGVQTIAQGRQKTSRRTAIAQDRRRTSRRTVPLARSSSPMLRASAARTYRSSIPLTASPANVRDRVSASPMQKSKSPVFVQKSKSPTFVQKSKSPVFVQKSKSPVFVQKSKSPTFVQKSKSPTFVQKSKSPVFVQKSKSPTFVQKSKSPTFVQKSKSPVFAQKLPSPMQKRRSPYIPSALKPLTNSERAAVYGRRGQQNKIVEELQKRKTECGRRGLMYNPITKQCTQQIRQSFGSCREDCARIGKRCGPKGKCIKL